MPDKYNELASHSEDEIDLSELFAALWRKKILITFISLSALIFGVLYADTLPDIYQSKATVLLSGKNTSNPITSLLPGGVSNNVDFDTSIKLLKSHRFLNSIVNKLSVPANLQVGHHWGVTDIENHLQVTKISNTNLLEISYKSTDPNFSAQLVNVVTANFIDYKVQLLQPGAKNNGDWLAEKIRHLREQLKLEQGQLNTFRYENSAIDISSLVKQGQHEINLLFTEQRSLIREREQLERHIKKITSYEHDINRIVTVKRITDVPVISGLLNSLEQLKIDLSQIKLRYLHKHPKHQAIIFKIEEIERQLATQVKHQTAQNKTRLKDVKHLLAAITAKQQVAKYNLDQSIIRVQEYEQINSDIQIHVELLKKLTSRQKHIEIVDNKGSIASFIIVDPARVPTQPIGPKKKLIIVIALLLGLMLATIVSLILHFTSLNSSNYRQVAVRQGFNIFGELPEVKIAKKNDPVLRGKGKDFQRYQEAIHSIRTNYIIDKSLSDNKLIAITSLMPNEGKSSCCLQLTRSFSELERVIIVDADLRAPSIASVLGESPHRHGLSNLIAGTHTFEQCVFRSEELNADVLPSGIRPNNALLFLSSTRFSRLLKALLRKYDRVILECPPLLSVSDALVIGKNVPGVTLVADVTKSTSSKFMRDMHELKHTNIDISGIILNRVKCKDKEYYGAYSQQNT